MRPDIGYSSERVIPAVMPNDFEHLKDEMSEFLSLVPLVQIDVMDGKFTDSKSWPYVGGIDKEFLKIINQEEGFPFWEDLDIEVDLMVSDPIKAVDQWIAAGAARVIVHFESAAPDVISSALKSIKDKGIEAGIAFGLETPEEKILSFCTENKENIDLVQCMGIEKIGYQGQPFSEKALERVKKLKESFPDLKVSMDGGVHLDSAPQLAEAGVDYLVVGSELHTVEGSPAEKIQEFDNILKI